MPDTTPKSVRQPPARAPAPPPPPLVGHLLGLTSLVALLVLVGWIGDFPALRSFSLSPATMKPNTAFGILLAAGALWLGTVEGPGRRWARLAGRLSAGLVVLLGGLTLSQDLAAIDLGIDQLLIPEPGGAALTGAPGRMSPTAALGFVLLGAAILVLPDPRRVVTAQLLAVGAGVLTLLALLGYAYGAARLYQPALIGPGYPTAVALPTALAFAGLIAGVLAFRPRRGIMAVVTSRTATGQAVRRLLFVAAVGPSLLGWLELAGIRAGLYGTEFGSALLVGLTIVALAGVTCWQGRATHRVEAALRDSEEQFRAMFSVSSVGKAQADTAGHFLRVNAAFCAMTGYGEAELLARTVHDITHPDDRDADRARFERLIRGEAPTYEAEKRYLRRDGTVVWVHVTANLIRDAAGRPRQTTAVIQDITARKEAEQRLRASEAHLRRVLDNLFAFVGVLTPDGTLVEANRAPLEAAGISADDVLGRKFWDCYWWSYSPEVQARLRDAIARANRGEVVRYDVPVRMARDSRMWIDFQLAPLRDEEGRITHLIPSGMDLTPRRRAEQALRESEAKHRRIAESGVIGVMEWRADGRVLDANDAWLSLTGYTREDLEAGRVRWTDLTPPEYRHRDAHHHEQLRARGLSEPYEKEYVRKDGTRVPVLVANALYEGSTTNGFSLVLDIAARRAAEERLRESESTLRSFYASSPLLMGVVEVPADDSDIIHVYDSPATERFFGQPSGSTAGRSARVLGAPAPAIEHWIRHYRASQRERRPVRFEYPHPSPDGPVWLSCVAACIGPSATGGTRFSYVAEDITERKRAETALRSAERMEAVGRLAGGVAHEANNQMTVVLGCASFALRRPDLPAELREELLHIRQAAESTAAITAQLLAFSRRQALRAAPLDLNAVVESFAPIVQRTLGDASRLVLDLSPRLDPVLADRSQIEQVLVNLTTNARDAMPDGGILTVSTDLVAFTEPGSGSHPAEPLPAGRYGVLAVRDTGHGMSPETLGRIFEPFFTTKPLGEGTGLGLSTVYGIVRQLGGDVRVESAPGAGTTFRIYLPLAESPVFPAGAAPSPPSLPAAGTVLVIEDEPQVRALVVRALRAEGFEVLEAEHGQAALELLERIPGRVQAVVSDVVMPVMGGRELAERLARSHPTVPVLLMSGYAADELVRRGMLAGGADALLAKPFAPEALVERVRALVEARRSAAG